jgi:hypothetical protein
MGLVDDITKQQLQVWIAEHDLQESLARSEIPQRERAMGRAAAHMFAASALRRELHEREREEKG